MRPEVLERALRAAGAIGPGVRVRAVRVRPVGGGLVGTVHRLAPTYSPAGAGPATVIAKSPGPFADVEARFYAVTPAPVRRPACYGVAAGTLLLADLGDGGFVPQLDGVPAGKVEAALRAVAGLHAAAPPDWVRPAGETPVAAFCRRQLRSHPGGWPAALGPYPALVADRFDRLAALVAAPATVAHGDFHSGNVCFRGRYPTLVDFQTLQRASALVDVARFLGTSVRPAVRRALEPAVLAGQDPDTYRAALLWNLCTPLALHLRRTAATGAGWPDRFPILNRCITAVEDWDAAAVLR